MIGLAQQQMEQAAEQLRKAGVYYQADRKRQPHDRMDDALKRAKGARKATHQRVREAQQDTARCRLDCAATSQFSEAESAGSYAYTISDANGNITTVILRQSYQGNGGSQSYAGSLPGDTDLPCFEGDRDFEAGKDQGLRPEADVSVDL